VISKPLGKSKSLIATLILLLSGIVSAKPALASTFIGNGGSTQDILLAATLAEINDIASKVNSNDEALCACSSKWGETEICRLLQKLTEAERKACRETIVSQAKQLMALTTRGSDIKFVWVDSNLRVKTPGKSARPVDALTQAGERRIIIDRTKFYEMPMSLRVALITHELFHLIPINARLLADEDQALPFPNAGRMFDTLGAAMAMEGHEQGAFSDFAQLEDISKPYKRHWITYDFHFINTPTKTTKSLLKSTSSTGYELSYTYRRDRLGFTLGLAGVSNSNFFSTNSDGIDVKEDLSLTVVGASYRWFPVNFYLSTWNPTFVTTGVNFITGRAEYSAKDRAMSITGNAPAIGIEGKIELFIPFKHEFWMTLGTTLRQVRYQYQNLKINIIENQNITSFGGAYAF
jgi:hypothetical protein